MLEENVSDANRWIEAIKEGEERMGNQERWSGKGRNGYQVTLAWTKFYPVTDVTLKLNKCKTLYHDRDFAHLGCSENTFLSNFYTNSNVNGHGVC